MNFRKRIKVLVSATVLLLFISLGLYKVSGSFAVGSDVLKNNIVASAESEFSKTDKAADEDSYENVGASGFFSVFKFISNYLPFNSAE